MQVNFDNLCGSLGTLSVSQDVQWSTLRYSYNLGDAPSFLGWATSLNTAEQQITVAVKDLLSGKQLLEMLAQAFATAATSSNSLNLGRLTTLHSLMPELLAVKVKKIMEAAAPFVHRLVQDAICKLMREHALTFRYNNPEYIRGELDAAVHGCIAMSVIQHVQMSPLVLPSDFQLQENAATGSQRAELTDRLQKLQLASLKVSQFEDNSSGPFHAAPAHMAADAPTNSLLLLCHQHQPILIRHPALAQHPMSTMPFLWQLHLPSLHLPKPLPASKPWKRSDLPIR